jgi:hypothetical protein
MAQPLWDSDGLLRRDALWRDADQVLTTRAMTRCALAAGWVALAALTIRGYAWVGGIPVLLSSGLSLLHASHTLVVGIEERLPHWHAALLALTATAVAPTRRWPVQLSSASLSSRRRDYARAPIHVPGRSIVFPARAHWLTVADRCERACEYRSRRKGAPEHSAP